MNVRSSEPFADGELKALRVCTSDARRVRDNALAHDLSRAGPSRVPAEEVLDDVVWRPCMGVDSARVIVGRHTFLLSSSEWSAPMMASSSSAGRRDSYPSFCIVITMDNLAPSVRSWMPWNSTLRDVLVEMARMSEGRSFADMTLVGFTRDYASRYGPE